MYEFQKIDSYDWFCGPGSHIKSKLVKVTNCNDVHLTMLHLITDEKMWKMEWKIIHLIKLRPHLILSVFNYYVLIFKLFIWYSALIVYAT